MHKILFIYSLFQNTNQTFTTTYFLKPLPIANKGFRNQWVQGKKENKALLFHRLLESILGQLLLGRMMKKNGIQGLKKKKPRYSQLPQSNNKK